MKKLNIFFFSFLFITRLAFQAGAVEVFRKDEVRLDMGIKGQIWAQSVEDAAPSGEDWSKDFSVKQIRIYTNGDITTGIKFGANFDFNNFGFVDGKEGTKESTLTDGFLAFDSLPAFQVTVGKFRAPFSRFSLTDSYTAYALPHAPFGADPKLAAGSGGFRMIGLTAWGIIGDLFRYNLGIADGTPEGLREKTIQKTAFNILPVWNFHRQERTRLTYMQMNGSERRNWLHSEQATPRSVMMPLSESRRITRPTRHGPWTRMQNFR